MIVVHIVCTVNDQLYRSSAFTDIELIAQDGYADAANVSGMVTITPTTEKTGTLITVPIAQ